MSNWRLVRLNFGRSPVHFGETGIGLENTTERVRSDTLFSAWISAYARIFGADGVELLLAQFTANPAQPPFRVSSTFVYRCPKNPKEVIYYLPKLLGRPAGYPSDDLSFAKTYKKLQYLPLKVWQRWYQGSGFSTEDAVNLETHTKDPDTESTLSRAGGFAYEEAFKGYTLPKIAVDRIHHATNFFHTGLIQFAWESAAIADEATWDNAGVQNLAGLYFLLELPTDAPELEADLQQALAVLGEEGMGGERSSGAGRFSVQAWESLPADWQAVVNFAQGNHHSLVSLFWQLGIDQTQLGSGACYAIHERGGWIASPLSGRQLRRQKLQMFAEGSVFAHKPIGQLADVTPSGFTRHAIYRSGLAVSLPVKLEAS
ncbi:MAG: type III-A CRISPR-associated RAMP protein Csm4 [Kaiparowitsia implicata GSE-PSE-MK54-09C]|nr:type III-A CRISPR-associated RAMP protein Csm4 [Kaiparowitsia implicata GSE-PSE-MK54-09C]